MKLYNDDCMTILPCLKDNSVDLTLTDIPYNEVNRKDNGLIDLNRKDADILTFDLSQFLEEVYRVTKSTIIIFCGKGQFSTIHNFFAEKQAKNKGTVRQIIFEKTNPCPMNGQHIYLSGIENAVWFKKRGGTFNAHCKNTVFRAPLGSSKFHPTEKNHKLLKELILDNSNEGDIVFDPCMGSGSTGLVAKENSRDFIGIELSKKYFEICKERLGGNNERSN